MDLEYPTWYRAVCDVNDDETPERNPMKRVSSGRIPSGIVKGVLCRTRLGVGPYLGGHPATDRPSSRRDVDAP